MIMEISWVLINNLLLLEIGGHKKLTAEAEHK